MCSYSCRLARARKKPWLARKWDDVTRYESFEWKTNRDPDKVTLLNRSLITSPITQNPFAESEGYQPANFDRLIKIGFEGDGVTEEVDDEMLFEAEPDYTPLLPSEE